MGEAEKDQHVAAGKSASVTGLPVWSMRVKGPPISAVPEAGDGRLPRIAGQKQREPRDHADQEAADDDDKELLPHSDLFSHLQQRAVDPRAVQEGAEGGIGHGQIDRVKASAQTSSMPLNVRCSTMARRPSNT